MGNVLTRKANLAEYTDSHITLEIDVIVMHCEKLNQFVTTLKKSILANRSSPHSASRQVSIDL